MSSSSSSTALVHFLFSQPLTENDQFINILIIQQEQQKIAFSTRAGNAFLRFKIATGTLRHIRDAVYDPAQLLHLSCHITEDKKYLQLELNHLEVDNVDGITLGRTLDECLGNLKTLDTTRNTSAKLTSCECTSWAPSFSQDTRTTSSYEIHSRRPVETELHAKGYMEIESDEDLSDIHLPLPSLHLPIPTPVSRHASAEV